MSRFDTVLKEMFLESPLLLAEELGGSPVREWLSIEFPRTRNPRADLVGRMEDGRLLHLELQGRNDAEMEWRALDYYGLIYRQTGTAPFQVVLYVGEKPLRMRDGINEPKLVFSYRLVDVREFDAEKLLASENVGDNLMAVLCRMQDRRDVVRRILARIDRMNPGQREDMLARLLVLSGLRGLEPVVRKESSAMALVIDPMKNSVLREWYEEAFAKGQIEGRTEGRTEAIRKMLERRFGPLPAWTIERLAAATSEQHEHWLLRILDAHSLDDVFNDYAGE
jgi:predicted transposase YdaD